ncbi:MAG: hypothetical protein AAGE52_27230 [Myxococcota bacterium]
MRGLGLLTLLLALACDDGGMNPVDGGSDARAVDAGEEDAGSDAGGEDTGVDAAADAGSGDAGFDAAMPPRQTRITAFIPGAITTVGAEFEDGSPAHFDAAAAFDHEAPVGEDLFASEGDMFFRATTASATALVFGEASALVDPGGAATTPDIWFSGDLGAGGNTLAAIVGSSARIYDFAADAFEGAVMLQDPSDMPFTPSSAAFLDPGTGTAVLFLQEGDSDLHFLNTATGRVEMLLTPTRCSDGTTIGADLVLGARLPGIGSPGLTEQLFVIEGTNAHVLEAGLCFGDEIALTDADGGPLDPDFAFGWDFNGDDVDDIILVDDVTR